MLGSAGRSDADIRIIGASTVAISRLRTDLYPITNYSHSSSKCIRRNKSLAADQAPQFQQLQDHPKHHQNQLPAQKRTRLALAVPPPPHVPAEHVAQH